MKTVQTAVTGIILETRKKNADDLHPVKLRVTFKKERKYYTVKGPDTKSLYMSKEDFDIYLTASRFKKLKIHLAQLEEQAMEAISKLPVFTFDAFEKEYFAKPVDTNDLFSAMASTAGQLRLDGRISTAVTYEFGIKSLKEFSRKEKLPFEHITVKFLKDYEKWMLTPRVHGNNKQERANNRTTVGIYLRNVRTEFNRIKPAGVPYPFGKTAQGLYAIPKGKNVKKAMTQVDVGKIAGYEALNGSIEQRSRDLWLFSYLCNGINMKDVARLKYANINGDKIILVRSKTAETVEEQSSIEIIITLQIRRIIDRWGTKPTLRENYIFPILHEGLSAEDEYKTILQLIQTTNKNMTRICKSLKIDRATTYTARHSFATVLKRSGASIEFISESLGHKSKQTTMNYLANFEDDEKRKWANVLLPESD